MKHQSTRRRAVLGLALLTSLTSLVGLAAPQPAAAAEAAVTITFTLEPQELVIEPNTAVTWTNTDGARHRMRATSGPADFDSGTLDPGETFTFTFTEEGTYQYHDDRNRDLSNYWGTIVVQSAGGSGGAPGGQADVRMAGRVFRPLTITIQAGESVTFLNDDGRDHTVTARDRSFDSGIMPPGADFVRTFAQPGTYEYFCALHPDMVGTVIVEGEGGTPPPPPAPPPPPPTGDVTIIDFDYQPGSITVTAGSTITWANGGAALHTVTARDGSYDSGLLSAGDTYSRTYATPGTYEYFCTLHPNMVGTVLVTGEGGEPPPPPSPAAPSPPPPQVAGDLSIVDFAYRPGTIEVAAGTTLTWANNGIAPHTVTARTGLFDSGIMANGETFSRTFSQPGTYQYFCTLHPDMTGTVIVPSPTGEVPPPEPAPPPPPPSRSGDVQMIDFAFSPVSLTVQQGTSITWVNTGVALHTATARNGLFDSGFLNTGDSFTYRFDQPGTYQYFCTLHPDMTGTIAVTASDGSVPEAVPAEDDPGVQPELSDLDAAIDMLDFSFAPVEVTVPAGTTLTWVNRGAALHTATALDGSFDSGFLATGETWSRTFDTPGSFPYLCTIHPGMTGTVFVEAATTSPAAGAPDDGTGAASPAGVAEDPPQANVLSTREERQQGIDLVFGVLFGVLGLYFLVNTARGFGLGSTREESG